MGPIQNPRLCVYHEGTARVSDGHFLWQVFYTTVSEGVYCGPNDVFGTVTSIIWVCRMPWNSKIS